MVNGEVAPKPAIRAAVTHAFEMITSLDIPRFANPLVGGIQFPHLHKSKCRAARAVA
jgi:hypothetical protein